MTQKSLPTITGDSIMKNFQERIEIPSRDEINMINRRLDRLEKLVYQKKTVVKPRMKSAKPAIRVKKSKIASDIVLDLISKHENGTDFKTIKAETSYNDKKLRNIIFRLDKIGRIRRVKRGVYKKA